MRKRYHVDTHIPRGSADGQLVIVDNETGDMLVYVDPNDTLNDGNRSELAQRIADALNSSHPAHTFEPEYANA